MEAEKNSWTGTLRDGICIPAHPLALNQNRRLDERRQRALSRYYLDAGAGGLAVGVHTTQFEIRLTKHALLKPVLELAAETARNFDANHFDKPETVLVAGICGVRNQAVREAELAMDLGYHAGLLSLSALSDATEDELLEHCRSVASVIPLVGFYLQPAVGGRRLPYSFWRQFVEIPEVVAIKVAPFNRYQTIDVMRAVAESDRWLDITMLTGNDDAIVTDLLSTYAFRAGGIERKVRFVGGLLGHWACWTSHAVRLLTQCKHAKDQSSNPSSDWETPNSDWETLLRVGNQVTDMNAAIFDAANGFRGCIAGVHEVLRRQGLLEGTWCLDPRDELSIGQSLEISRVCQSYSQLTDDTFVYENLDKWLA